LLDNTTEDPPAGAATLSVTLHVELPPDPKEAGVQLNAFKTGCTGMEAVIVPPEPVIGSVVPPALTPSVPVTPMAALETPDPIVAVTTATVPFCNAVVLNPVVRQM
jgi:hypothetical protein